MTGWAAERAAWIAGTAFPTCGATSRWPHVSAIKKPQRPQPRTARAGYLSGGRWPMGKALRADADVMLEALATLSAYCFATAAHLHQLVFVHAARSIRGAPGTGPSGLRATQDRLHRELRKGALEALH